MQRLSGALMVLAGVALGGYSFLPATDDPVQGLADVTHVSAAADHDAKTRDARITARSTLPAVSGNSRTDDGGVRVFSPTAPLVTPVPGSSTGSRSGTTTTWTAVVTSEPAAATKFKSSKPGDAEARSHLASDLQRELKRVGCYGGEITGAWTQSTRRAMSLFMERVNATLPVDEPDYILLTLVQGHAAIACGTDCPAGQMQSASGRCLPNAVVAQANRKMQRLEERAYDRRMEEQRKGLQQERLAKEQRAVEAKRIAAAQRSEAQRLAAAASAKFSTFDTGSLDGNERSRAATLPAPAARPQIVAGAKTEALPWLADQTAAVPVPRPAATQQYAARGAPLPGMMSVGGPRTAAAAPTAGADIVEPNRAARPALAPDTIDRDNLDTAATSAPAPLPATRGAPPIREAALQGGLPDTKAGPDGRAYDVYSGEEAQLRKYRPAKIVRRDYPYGAGPKLKPKYYAYNSGGKTRRGQPRPGTPRYNLLQSLGGIY